MSPCLFKSVIFIFFAMAIFSPGFLLPEKVSAAGSLPTYIEVQLSCGDGYAEIMSGEACDPGTPPDIPEDLGTTTCASFNDVFGNPFVSGNLDCLSDCTAFDSDMCYSCGNGAKEVAEECDGSDFAGKTCITLGYQSGALVCSLDCRVSTAGCVPMETQPGTPGGGSHGGGSGSASGFLPGSNTESVTKVIAQGKSYPHADVHILVDGVVTGIVKTDALANFYFETVDIKPGVAGFGFWSTDLNGLKSTLLTLTFRVISGAVTTISGVYIAPTIDIDKQSVRQGEPIKIFGQTVPSTEVHVHINSEKEFIEKISSAETGSWELSFDTAPLEEDLHTAKAFFQGATEGNFVNIFFSRSVNFYVGKPGGEGPWPEAVLNHDGRVNLTDFSILLYWWGTDNACADQNQNGVVDLVDFSIMMYYWTG